MKIPYGISNFKDLITGGYVYIDKTDYIAKLEEAGKYHILLRPRRFGKSLMLSALEYYYDIGSKTDFDAIFSQLYIGKHPTPLQSSYQVLFMEFSGIETGSHEQILSGFNVNVNIYLQATKAEVAGLLQPLTETCQLDAEKLMEDVTRWYNGYRFHPNARETVYNANMVLYFLKNFDREECAYPERMLDDNIASDYGKLMGLFKIGNPDENYAVLDELINTGEVIAQQRRKFDFDKGFDREDFISLLAYMGFASLQGKTLSGEVFAIPNHVMQELYFLLRDGERVDVLTSSSP